MANWTPASFFGQLFRLIGRYIPPAPGTVSPSAWGMQERLRELFRGRATRIGLTPRDFVFRYWSPMHFAEVFRIFYGPINMTYAALEAPRQAVFTEDLLALIAEHNRSGASSRRPRPSRPFGGCTSCGCR